MKKIFKDLLNLLYFILAVLIVLWLIKLISPYLDVPTNPLYGIWFLDILALFIIYCTYKKTKLRPVKLLGRTILLGVAFAVTSAMVYSLTYNRSPTDSFGSNFIFLLALISWGAVVISHKGYKTKT